MAKSEQDRKEKNGLGGWWTQRSPSAHPLTMATSKFLRTLAALTAGETSTLVCTKRRVLLSKIHNDGVTSVGVHDWSGVAVVEYLILLTVWLNAVGQPSLLELDDVRVEIECVPVVAGRDLSLLLRLVLLFVVVVGRGCLLR